MTETYFHTLTFCSVGINTLNDNDYDITQSDDMLAWKRDAEKRILAKTNSNQDYSSARRTGLQTEIAEKQLELVDSHRTFSQP